MNYVFHLLIYLAIYVILALSLNLVVGYLGRLSLAHAGFTALGAYAYALATLRFDLGFMPALLLAITLAVLLSPLLSVPSWRFRSDFFLLTTLAVQIMIQGVIENWYAPEKAVGSWANLTNGPFGIAGIPKPDILGCPLTSIGALAALAIGLAMFCALIVFRLGHSPWGRLLRCLRDDEVASRSLGKTVRTVKMQVFALSCGFAASAGVIYASYVSFVDPSIASLDESILLLCMLCVGGMGNFRGPIIGAVVLLLLPEALRLTPLPQAAAASARLLIYGLLMILMVHFRPQGIAGQYRLE